MPLALPSPPAVWAAQTSTAASSASRGSRKRRSSPRPDAAVRRRCGIASTRTGSRATGTRRWTASPASSSASRRNTAATSVAVISTGQIMTEEFYTLGKLVRGVIGTNNYDGNTTLCMASAVAGYKRSFGADGPPGCYGDFDHTECLLAFGSNLPEQHPIIYWRLKEALEKRKFPVIVVDPRVTMFAQFADIHLPITPGTDLVLLNSLCHVILDEGLADEAYIRAHTEGFEDLAATARQYDPTTAARICGIDEDTIRTVARLYGKAGRGDGHLDDGHQPVHPRHRWCLQPSTTSTSSPATSASPAARASPSPANAMRWARGNGRPAPACRAIGSLRTRPTARKWASSGTSIPSSSPPSGASSKPTSSPPSRPARSRRSGSSPPIP